MNDSQTNTTTTDVVIDDLSVSAKLVYKILEYEGPLTQQEIAEETNLALRTVRKALSRLEEADLLETRPNLADARQQIYTLSINQSEETDSGG